MSEGELRVDVDGAPVGLERLAVAPALLARSPALSAFSASSDGVVA